MIKLVSMIKPKFQFFAEFVNESIISKLNTHESQNKHFMCDLNRCMLNNHTKFELDPMRIYSEKIQLTVLTFLHTVVTFAISEGHCNCLKVYSSMEVIVMQTV